jgi:ribosomal protein S8
MSSSQQIANFLAHVKNSLQQKKAIIQINKTKKLLPLITALHRHSILVGYKVGFKNYYLYFTPRYYNLFETQAITLCQKQSYKFTEINKLINLPQNKAKIFFFTTPHGVLSHSEVLARRLGGSLICYF